VCAGHCQDVIASSPECVRGVDDGSTRSARAWRTALRDALQLRPCLPRAPVPAKRSTSPDCTCLPVGLWMSCIIGRALPSTPIS
jgi:hypothetical protein